MPFKYFKGLSNYLEQKHLMADSFECFKGSLKKFAVAHRKKVPVTTAVQ